MAARAKADTEKASAGADTSVKGVDRSYDNTVTESDVGATEAQRRGLAENSDFNAHAAHRMMTEALDHVNNQRRAAETITANMIANSHQVTVNSVIANHAATMNALDMAYKAGLRAIKMVTDVADDAIAGEIVEDVVTDG